MVERSLLIVDDERSILAALRMIFEGKYTVHTAENGSEALKLLHEKAPDLILLDLGLPDTRGTDLLEQIKSLVPETKIIMMTAMEDANMVEKAHELGAFDYLVKPIDAQMLKAAIRKAFARRDS